MTDGQELSDWVQAVEGQSLEAVGLIGGAWALRKVVGPSLDVIGGALGRMTERRVQNLGNLSRRLAARFPNGAPQLEQASVHPRTAKFLIDEASWVDDEVMQEYFAGMLIGAASDGPAEGDMMYFARLAASLAPEHLRLHHAVYEALRFGPELFAHPELRPGPFDIYVPSKSAPEMSGENAVVHKNRLNSLAIALQRERLLGTFEFSSLGPKRAWLPQGAYGHIYGPTSIGAELFAAAYGERKDFLNFMYHGSDQSTLADMPRFETFMHQELVDSTQIDGTGEARGVWVDRRETR